MQIRRGRAVGAAALAIVVAACTLLAGWHQATVIHARCAQHGELYDVGDAGLSHKKLGDHQLAARDGDGGDQHDHCSLCPRAHDGTPPISVHVPVAMPPVAAAPLAAAHPIAIASATTFRTAPKTSPPDHDVASAS